jgi:deazaflavin-dependent oxidoreductase (nitroreductase family)
MRKRVIIGAAAMAGSAAIVYLLLTRPFGAHQRAATTAQAETAVGKQRPRSEEFPQWVRRFDRRLLNPLVLLVAGRRHSADYAILRHVGRRSGRVYTTPVVAHSIPGGYLIALPYGSDTDWCRNVQVAGAGTLQRQGNSYVVGEPEVLEAAVAVPLLPPRVQRALRPFHIQRYLRLRQLGDSAVKETATLATAAGGTP